MRQVVAEPSCPGCGSVIRTGQRFCHECGEPLAASAGDVDERRLLTALRCRLVGAALDVSGEEVDEGLVRLLDLMSAEVAHFGGTVIDRAGHALTALIGAPVAHEDHARRAVLAALAIQETLEHGRSGVPSVSARIGISTGEVVVRLRDARMLSAVGTAVDEADMLAERAALGGVLIGVATEEAVRGYVACRPLERNAAGAPAGFVVTGRGRRVSRLDRADRRLTRFVGRDRQVMALGELLEEVLVGRGQVVGVAADAGMGKSRLVSEFLTGAAAGVRVREGRCVSYATAAPLVPIADLVRAQIGLTSPTASGRILDALERRLAGLGLDSARHAPYLANMLGSGEAGEIIQARSPEAIREATFESLVALLVAEAAEEPTILVIEDLHWIDPVSRDVIARFVESLPGRRAMVLCTYRPGFPAPWMGVSYATQLSLPPLSPAASRSIVESIIGDLRVTPTLLDAAVARADGNPFFLEELSYAVAGGAQGVPATVHDVLLARIDQLDPAARRLLRTASVLGREFSGALLAAIWTGDRDLETLLDELRRREFLHEGRDGRTLIFRHALTHDVAYSGLTASRRRELHRTAGEALEGMHAGRLEEAYGRLGFHFSRAGEDVRAVEYLALAAERALLAYSNESAAEALELALGHLERVDDPALRRRAPVLIFRLAFTLYLLGRFRDALDRLESPLAQPDSDEPSLLAEHDFWLSYFHTHLGNSEAARVHATRAIAAAQRIDDRFTAGRAHYVLTREDFWLCRYAQGIENGRRAVELLEGSDDWWWWLGHASSWKGLCHLDRGEFQEALRDCTRMNAIGVERDDPRLQSYSDWNLGWIEATRGNAAAGTIHCMRSLRRSPDPLNSAYSTGWLGFCHRENGDHVEAVDHLERSIAALRGFGYSRLVGWFSAWLADAYLLAGRSQDARRAATEGLEVSGDVGYPWAVAVATRAVGRIAEADGDLGAAAERMADALHRFATIDADFDAAVTRLDLARVTAGSGDDTGARALARTALAAFDAMAAPAYSGRARAMLGAHGVTAAVARERASAQPVIAPYGLRLKALGRLSASLGDVVLTDEALGGDSGRRLLAALVAARVPVHRDRLVAWLWPGSAPDAGDAALAEASDALTRVLGESRIDIEGPVHRLALGPHDACDAFDLMAIAAGADGGEASAEALEKTLLDYAAPPLQDWPTAEWSRPLRVACAEALTRLRGRLADALLREGRHEEARMHFAQLADARPEDESWHRGVMRCHAATGDTALALRQYHVCRSALRQLRGTDPSPEMQALYLELLAGR